MPALALVESVAPCERRGLSRNIESIGTSIVASVCSVLNVNDNAPAVRYIAVCLRLNIVRFVRFSGTELFRKLSLDEPSRN